ncbi:MAG: sigma-70 family RNA polymerase sigma factor [Planctomycetota bacterium]|nr:sigma-70 family RNA polymerase sigma factor [Planctomycetota bacterium]
MAVEAVPQTKADWALLRSYHRERRHEDFAELVQRYQDAAFRAAFARCGQAAQAEEAVQEAFLLLTRPDLLPETHDRLDFRLWFLGVVSNVSRHLARSERRQSRRAQHPAYQDRVKDMNRDMTAPDADATVAESRAALLDALGELKEEHRLPLVLHFLEGLTQAEVGQVIGLSQSRVARRIGEALKLVRLRLARTGVMLSAATLPALLRDSGLLKAPPTLQAALAHPSLLNCVSSSESLRQAAVLPEKAAQAGKFLFAACGGLFLLGTTLWFAHRALSAGAAAGPAAPTVQAAEPLPFHRVWNFEQGPSDEMRVVQGVWNWEPKPARHTPCMVTERDNGVLVLLPGPLPAGILRIRVEAWLPEPMEWAGSAVYLDAESKMVPHDKWLVWRSAMYRDMASLMKLQPLEIYAIGPHVVTVFNGEVSSVSAYDRARPSDRLALILKNWRATRIEAEELSEEAVPRNLRDVPALIRSLKAKRMSVNSNGKETAEGPQAAP